MLCYICIMLNINIQIFKICIFLCAFSAYLEVETIPSTFAQQLECFKQSECNDREEVHCGICVENDNLDIGKCIFPFTGVYKGGNSCLKEMDCGKCNDRGSCKQVVYRISCFCNDGYYGDNCEHSTPPEMYEIVYQHVETAIISIATPNMLYIKYLAAICPNVKNAKWKLRIELSTKEGYLENYETVRENCNSYHLFTPQVKFPYIVWENPDGKFVYKLGNNILGYLSVLEVRLSLSGIENYIHQQEETVFVSYQEANLQCIPVITELSGCAFSRLDPVVYFRSSAIEISSEVHYYEDGRYVHTTREMPECANTAKFKWILWKNQYDDDAQSTKKEYDKKEVFYSPFELEIGSYRVFLEIEVVQAKPSKNYAYCYFQIKSQPLVAVIEGGSEITISRRTGFELSAKGSGDPNMPPNNQGHVYATWTCVNIQTMQDVCYKTTVVTDDSFVSKEDLEFGAVYNVTVKIWTLYYENCKQCENLSPKFAFIKITVLNLSDDSNTFLKINCLGSNCRKKVLNNHPFVLQAESNHKSDVYLWTFQEEGKENEENITKIAFPGLIKSLITTKENVLVCGKSYTFVLRVLGTNLVAKYYVEIDEVVFLNGTCYLEPTTGTAGQTVFTIGCENFASGSIYEFYDKYEEDIKQDIVFSGRMLGTSMEGELRNVRLTRGLVIVYIIDSNSGLYTYKQLNTTLQEWPITKKTMATIYRNLTKIAKEGDNSRILRYISFIPDVLLKTTTIDKSKTLKTLLDFVTLVSINSLADVKLTTSTLSNVLFTLNKPNQLGINSELLRNTLNVVQRLSVKFKTIVGKKESEPMGSQFSVQGMSPKEIIEVAKYQMNSLHAALLCKDSKTEEISELDNDVETLEELMQSTEFAEDTINYLQDTLAYLQFSGLLPLKISSHDSTYVMWVIKFTKDFDITNYLEATKDIPVRIPKKLLNMLQREIEDGSDLSLQVTKIDDNLFWWRKSDVESNFISVSLAKQRIGQEYKQERRRKGIVKYKSLKSSIGLSVNLRSYVVGTKFSGSVTKTDAKSEEEDLPIRVHRLDPTLSSLLSIKFIFPETNNSLLVCTLSSYRPGFKEMKHKSNLITDKSPFYLFGGYNGSKNLYQNKQKETYIYVGIVPGPGVSINQTVKYTFEVNTTLCQYWARGQWSSAGCQVYDKQDLEVTCGCEHLSIFSAAFPVPPQEIDPFSDAKLFLNLLDNPIVVAFIIIVLFVYLFFCLLAWRKDKVDKRRRNVIILDDSFPEDQFPYLVAVYTSSRFNAGTTAHVGIKISGDLGESRAHILESKERKVLKKSFDDWFLLLAPKYLGTVQSIHIWHDNTGSNPEWFCSKIVVHDISKRVQFVFVIEQWLALKLNYFPEAIAFPSPFDTVKTVKRLFLDNCMLGLRENHTFLSIMLRHSRSEISRLQRTSIFMCCLMTAMLCSIMFYIPPGEGNFSDDYRYTVELRDFYISVQTLVVSLLITAVVFFTFRRSYKNKKDEINSSLSNELGKQNSFQNPSIYSNFVKIVAKTLKGKALAPAQLPFSNPVFVVRKTWLIIAWVSCLTVILVCSWCIMLYGLKMGSVKSKKWLLSVVLSIGEDIIVAGPVKIILFSIILSLALQKYADEDTHRVHIEDVDLLEMNRSNDESWFEKLLLRRSHRMYSPLQTDARQEMIVKKKLFDKWWTVIDFSVALLFIFVVSAVIFRLFSSQFYLNNCIRKLMTDSRSHEIKDQSFYEIKYIEDLEIYLKHSFIESVYRTFWYNHEAIDNPNDVLYWTKDFTHITVGLQQLRQLRVTSKDCHFKFINTTKKCIHHWKPEFEEKDSYSSMWKQPEQMDLEETNSPWQYRENRKSKMFTSYRLFGASGELYGSGGYSTLIGPTVTDAFKTTTELKSAGWQDELTRAVFIELTVFNCNLHLFSQVTMIVEYLVMGSIKIRVQVKSTESTLEFNFWNFLFVLFIVYYIIRSGYLINKLGLMEYLEFGRNRSRLIVVFMGVVCIALASEQHFSSVDYYHRFVLEGLNSYFDFDTFIFHALVLQYLLSLLIAVAMFRTVMIVRGGRSLLNHIYTLLISISWILWLALITILCSFVQSLFTILLNIMSLPKNTQIDIDLKSLRFLKTQELELSHVRLFFLVKVFSISVLFGVFIVMFMYNARLAKVYRKSKNKEFNLVTFVISQLKTVLNKVMKQRKH